MKILGLDSSGLVASVAVAEDDHVLAEYTVNYKKTHSQTLLPMLDAAAQMIDLDLHSLDAIAVAAGPGSFTGLRIGSATAKGLGFALDKPLIPVPTLEGLAYNLAGAGSLVCPMLDARRGQVYTGLYQFDRNEMSVLLPQCAVPIEEIAEKINAAGKETVLLGDGTPVHEERLKQLLRVPYYFAPPHQNRQRAASIVSLAFRYAADGKFVSAAAHRPDYLRESNAERSLAKAAKTGADVSG